MPSLIVHTSGAWTRWPLPLPGNAIIGSAGDESAPTVVVCADDLLAAQLPQANGLIVVTASGPAYHVLAAQNGHLQAFFNAETQPSGELRQLIDRDRITYHNGAPHPLRVWFLQQDGAVTYSGTPANLACGYCGQSLAIGESLRTCSCGETLHVECAQHSGNRCPRCKNELAAADAVWWPDGFSLEDEAEDDW
jgi:hypothetical protein